MYYVICSLGLFVFFKDVSEEEKIEILTDVDIAVAKIADWKSHILRCVNQDRSRLHTLESLADGNAMLVLDWAMKFLPLLHREKQSDFFGQKGFSWHVAVLIYKENETSTLKVNKKVFLSPFLYNHKKFAVVLYLWQC